MFLAGSTCCKDLFGCSPTCQSLPNHSVLRQTLAVYNTTFLVLIEQKVQLNSSFAVLVLIE